MKSITEILSKSSDGQAGETDKLFTVMYDDLRRLAGRFLQNEPLRNRLSSSSFVHQAYMRMVDQSRINWQGKTCLLYTSPSPRDQRGSRMPSSA